MSLNRVFPCRRTTLRKMRIMDAFAGSGRLATQCCNSSGVVQTPDCLILLPNKHMVFERLEVKGVVASSAAESLLHVRSLVSGSHVSAVSRECLVHACLPESIGQNASELGLNLARAFASPLPAWP